MGSMVPASLFLADLYSKTDHSEEEPMPNAYELMSNAELDAAIVALEDETERLRALDLKLDMARGKPSPEQIALSLPMLDLIDSTTPLDDGGLPVGNYGAPDGLPSARALAAQIMGVDPANVVVTARRASTSCTTSYATPTRTASEATPGVSSARSSSSAPAPVRPAFPRERALRHRERPGAHARGRPRHGDDRPSRGGRPCRQGCLVVPKFANPTGITYSDEVVRQFANIHPAAPTSSSSGTTPTPSMPSPTRTSSSSTSSTPLPRRGSPIWSTSSALTGQGHLPARGHGVRHHRSPRPTWPRSAARFSVMRVSPEKFSQLAHVLFLRDLDGVKAHNEKGTPPWSALASRSWSKAHRGSGRPAVCDRGRIPREVTSSRSMDPRAPRRPSSELAADLGVKMTPAGATLALRQRPTRHQHPHRPHLPIPRGAGSCA